MNPKDIMNDAIHNFHPQYQQYTQYTAPPPNGAQRGGPYGANLSTAVGEDDPQSAENQNGTVQSNHGRKRGSQPTQGRQVNSVTQGGYTEKTTLLSSDDEFQ